MDNVTVEVGVLSVCWLMAVIFAMAVKHKVFSWPRFKAAFTAYRIVPERYAGFAVGVLVAGEVTAVFALLSLQPLGLIVAGSLVATYAFAIGVNVLRGRTQIDCGCSDEPTPVSLTLLARNVFLLVLVIGAYIWQPTVLVLTWGTTLVALSAALIAFGIYNAADQLIANRGRYQRLWLGLS